MGTKSEQWAYEKEWRIVRVLSEARHKIDRAPFPVCLFEFPADAVREIIVGMRSPPSLVAEIRSLAADLHTATLLRVIEDPCDYGLVINELG